MSFNVRIESAVFSEKIREYARLLRLDMATVVTNQAKLLAKRLQDLTYPKTAAQGKGKVGADIGKVYLENEWFEQKFSFTNKKLGERVRTAVREKSSDTLRGIFSRSSALSKLHIEPFDASKHEAARRDGRVYFKKPYSFPLTEQSKVKKLVKDKKKNVGTAKAGWAACLAALGGSVPSWLRKSGTGGVKDETNQASPRIILTNSTRVFSALDAKHGIVARALAGRSRDMIKSAEKQLKETARRANLAP